MRKLGCFGLVLLLAYLLLWPVAQEMGTFHAADPPALSGPYAPNELLVAAERIPAAFGPEEVAFDAAGRMVTGVEDGRILRFEPDGKGPEPVADTGGRPLGMGYDGTGSLIVADGSRGLISVDAGGAVKVLTAEAEGAPIGLADDLDIAADGTVYFSDASIYPLKDKLLHELLDGRPHGRLLAYEPASGQTRVLLRSLYFANGVALSADGNCVLVTETAAYRVTRYWLRGPKQGQSETFIENLPGFPDNITLNARRDGYWLALASPRLAMVQTLQRSEFLRRILLRLPAALLPAPKPASYGFVLGLGLDGRVTKSLQDPAGKTVFQVTSVVEHDGTLFLGTIGDDAIKRLPVP